MRIDEAKACVAGERDALAGRRQRAVGQWPSASSRAARRGDDGVEIDVALGRVGGRSMNAARSGCSAACTRPRCRSGSASAVSRGSAPSTGMPSAAIASATSARWRALRDPIEDDAGDADGRIVRGKAAHHRGRRLRLPRHVEHQHHRQPNARRDRRWRRAGRAAGRGAVEQAHDAFDHQMSAPSAAFAASASSKCRRHRPAIEIDARRAGGGACGKPDRYSPGPLCAARTSARAGAAPRAARASRVVLPAPECGAAMIRPRAVMSASGGACAAAEQLLAHRTISPITTIAGGSKPARAHRRRARRAS